MEASTNTKSENMIFANNILSINILPLLIQVKQGPLKLNTTKCMGFQYTFIGELNYDLS